MIASDVAAPDSGADDMEWRWFPDDGAATPAFRIGWRLLENRIPVAVRLADDSLVLETELTARREIVPFSLRTEHGELCLQGQLDLRIVGEQAELWLMHAAYPGGRIAPTMIYPSLLQPRRTSTLAERGSGADSKARSKPRPRPTPKSKR